MSCFLCKITNFYNLRVCVRLKKLYINWRENKKDTILLWVKFKFASVNESGSCGLP